MNQFNDQSPPKSSKEANSTDYPTLKSLGFEDRDIHRLKAVIGRNTINSEAIKSFPLGTAINTIDSTYLPFPVFDMALLNKDNKIRLDSQRSRTEESMVMRSNKTAATMSWSLSNDANIGVNVMGVFGASAAAHYDHSEATAKSDGAAYASIVKGKSNVYYELLTGDLAEGFNLTPYLIGNDLNDPESDIKIEDYVSYTERQVAENDIRTYIDSVTFNGINGSGLIDWGNLQYYGNIQLITEMETIFGMLREQYDTFEGNQVVQATLLSLMCTVKEKIGHAVMDFKAHIGTHFVSNLKLGNYAYGYGKLNFDESYGSAENRYGASLSLSGSIPNKASANAGASVGFARKNGWGAAMKDLSVTVDAFPADAVVSLSEFRTSIASMLGDESKPLRIPDLSVPETPKVTVKEPEAVKKKSVGPPDCVFASYKEWLKYQDDKKNENEIEKKQEEAIEEQEEDPGGFSDDDDDDQPDNEMMTLTGQRRRSVKTLDEQTALHEDFMKEISRIRSAGPMREGSPTTDIIKIDDMFAYAFEITPYDYVIPALRTMKIELPEEAGSMDFYPNATKLLTQMHNWRKAVEYVNFISQFSVSNINESFRESFKTFYAKYVKAANQTITSALSAGHDVEKDNYRGFLTKMYRTDKVTGCQLYKDLGSDMDRFNYIRYLLESPQYNLWKKAPGGYAPFAFLSHTGEPYFGQLESIMISLEESGDLHDLSYWLWKSKLVFDTKQKLTDTPQDVSVLYDGLTQSPLYPVFRYQQKNAPKLLFLQFAGKYQLIYGKNGVILPFVFRFNEFLPIQLDQSCFSAPAQDISKSIINELNEYIEGYDPETDFDNDYALYFSDKTQTPELRESFRVLLLPPKKSKPLSTIIHPLKALRKGVIFTITAIHSAICGQPWKAVCIKKRERL